MFEPSVANTTPSAIQNNQTDIGFDSNNRFGDLIEQFGRVDVNGAINNVLGTTLGDLVKKVINDSPLPDFVKDAASEAINGAVANERTTRSPEAEMATQDELGDAIDEMLKGMTEAADEMMNEEAEGGTEGGVKGRGKAGGGGSNWLVALAKALGDVAGQHLGKSVEMANEISALAEQTGGDDATNAAQAREMTALQAQMQAETQMFKLAQEATTTIVKSVGEALTSTARKQ